MAATLKLKAQLIADGEIAFGPGKAQLLEAIDTHGSISAAGRALGISYRRAWTMVETMNRRFARPLVATVAGGRGGARLTDAGRAALAGYAALQDELDALAARQGSLLEQLA